MCENKTKQNAFDATQKRSEYETLLLRYCKFLIQIVWYRLQLVLWSQ